MARRPVEVVSGFRSPTDYPERQERPEAPIVAKAQDPEVRIYVSHIRSLRILLRSEPDRIVDGFRIPGRNLAAQFDQGVFRTKDPEVIRLLELKPTFGVDFYDSEKVQVQAAEKEVEQFAARLDENPKLREALRARFAGDFPAQAPAPEPGAAA